MKKWKLRFRRFEGFYKKGDLLLSFIYKLETLHGKEAIDTWWNYCEDKYGPIVQKSIIEEEA